VLSQDGKKEIQSIAVMPDGKIATIVVTDINENKLVIYDVGVTYSWVIPAGYTHLLSMSEQELALAGVFRNKLEVAIYTLNQPAKTYVLDSNDKISNLTEFNDLGDYFVLHYRTDRQERKADTREKGTMRLIGGIQLSDDNSQLQYEKLEKVQSGFHIIPEIKKIIVWSDQEVLLCDTGDSKQPISTVRCNVALDKQKAFVCSDGRIVLEHGYTVCFPELTQCLADLKLPAINKTFASNFTEVDITERPVPIANSEKVIALNTEISDFQDKLNQNQQDALKHEQDVLSRQKTRHMSDSSVMFAQNGNVKKATAATNVSDDGSDKNKCMCLIL